MGEINVNAPIRVNLEARCNTDDGTIKKNCKMSRRYQRVVYPGAAETYCYEPCAVVGGSPNIINALHVLRQWKGDIFAINDTAGYLSAQGIPHYLLAIDCDPNPWKIGPLTKGAVFASRVHRNQMKQFKRAQVRIFNMAEDGDAIDRGVEGGPTAVCRTPHLLLRMGYQAVYYFGIDSCFYNETHITGTYKTAHANMMIIRVKDVDYLSNAALLLQVQHMVDVFRKYPQFLKCASGGLMRAMLEHPDDWSVVAITEDLKGQYQRGDQNPWQKVYTPGEKPIWQPPAMQMGGA